MNSAFVHIWGELVGAVAWDETTGVASFEYDPRFSSKGWELAPLRMPLSTGSKTFSFPELRRKKDPAFDTFKGLPGMLADALPDRYGHELINLWLAQQGRFKDSMNPVEMLCFLGTRGMGALEFEPATWKENKRSFSIELDALVDVTRKMLEKKEAFQTKFSKSEAQGILDILRIGTSAGGARPKAVIAYNETTGEVRSGQTNAPKGFEHWLIKLDGVSDVQLGASKGYGRVEMAYYNMATACGIHMMPSRLLEENGRAHFITKRFDRDSGNMKHHVQTFCAMQHFDYNEVTNYSYEQLFETMRALGLPYDQAEQMFRRMVFNVVARNCDDHTKNFAFLLKKNEPWQLAPAYDVCHAYQPKHQWVSQHALSIGGKRSNIRKEDVLRIGKSIGNKNAAVIVEEIQSTVKNWKRFANEVEVAPALRDAIDDTLIALK